MSDTGKCPFCKQNYPLYDGPTPQKQGTVVCPEHGRNTPLGGEKSKTVETPAEESTGAGDASHSQAETVAAEAKTTKA